MTKKVPNGQKASKAQPDERPAALWEAMSPVLYVTLCAGDARKGWPDMPWVEKNTPWPITDEQFVAAKKVVSEVVWCLRTGHGCDLEKMAETIPSDSKTRRRQLVAAYVHLALRRRRAVSSLPRVLADIDPAFANLTPDDIREAMRGATADPDWRGGIDTGTAYVAAVLELRIGALGTTVNETPTWDEIKRVKKRYLKAQAEIVV